jgi:3-phenylpropionate/trans-cinnamate dioxygenase ferredoxin subunit
MTSCRERPLGALADLPPGQRKLVFWEGRSAVVFNIDGQLHAIENACPHGASALSGGRLEGCYVTCPAHGLRFDVRTGRMAGANGLSVATYPVRIDGEQAFMGTEAQASS